MDYKYLCELLLCLLSHNFNLKINIIEILSNNSSIENYKILLQLLKQNDEQLLPYVNTALNKIKSLYTFEQLNDLNEQPIEFNQLISELKVDEVEQILNSNDEEEINAILVLCQNLKNNSQIANLIANKLITENNVKLIEQYLITLSKIGCEKHIPIIANYLNYPDNNIKKITIDILNNFNTQSAIPYLLKSLKNESDDQVIFNILLLLLKFKNELIFTHIKNMLNSENKEDIETANSFILKINLAISNFSKNFKQPNNIVNLSQSTKNISQNSLQVKSTKPELIKDNATITDNKSKIKVVTSNKLKNNYLYFLIFILLIAILGVFIYKFKAHNYSIINNNHYNFTNNTTNEINLNQYELISEIEKLLFNNNVNEAEISLKILKNKNFQNIDINIIKLFEAHLMILENKPKDAINILKSVNIKDSYYYYLLSKSYFKIGNLNKAISLAETGIQINTPKDKYINLINNLISEINLYTENLLNEYKQLSNKTLSNFFSILNNEGPKATKQYFSKKSTYNHFENKWRNYLLNVKQYQIDYEIININLPTNIYDTSSCELEVNVLELWQYQNYGGICSIHYEYNNYYLIFTPNNYEFETDSIKLPLLISNINKVNFNINNLEKYEKDKINELLTVTLLDSNDTKTISLIKENVFKNLNFIPLIFGLFYKNINFSKLEIDKIIEYVNSKHFNEQSLKYFPNNLNIKSTILDLIANCLLDCNEIEQYKLLIDKIILEDKTYANAYFEKAILMLNEGKTNECEMYISKALQIEPDFPSLDLYFQNDAFLKNEKLMYEFEIKMSQNIIDEFEKLIHQYPNYWRTYFNIAKILMVFELYEKAENFLKVALDISPNNCSILTKLAFCYKKLNKNDLALKYIQQALKLEPLNFQVKRMYYLINKNK